MLGLLDTDVSVLSLLLPPDVVHYSLTSKRNNAFVKSILSRLVHVFGMNSYIIRDIKHLHYTYVRSVETTTILENGREKVFAPSCNPIIESMVGLIGTALSNNDLDTLIDLISTGPNLIIGEHILMVSVTYCSPAIMSVLLALRSRFMPFLGIEVLESACTVDHHEHLDILLKYVRPRNDLPMWLMVLSVTLNCLKYDAVNCFHLLVTKYEVDPTRFGHFAMAVSYKAFGILRYMGYKMEDMKF